jgi:hypothetical protein
MELDCTDLKHRSVGNQIKRSMYTTWIALMHHRSHMTPRGAVMCPATRSDCHWPTHDPAGSRHVSGHGPTAPGPCSLPESKRALNVYDMGRPNA